jgi:hypothetical protein
MGHSHVLCFRLFCLTSRPRLNETVLGDFDFAKIMAGGPKNKLIDVSYSKFIAKSIGENRNRLAFVVWQLFQKNCEGVAEIWAFFRFLCSSFLVNC